MDISHILSSFKTDEEYYSILEDKIISKVDWEEKDTEEKEYCYVDFGIWTLFFKDSWLVSLIDQRIVEEAAHRHLILFIRLKRETKVLYLFMIMEKLLLVRR